MEELLKKNIFNSKDLIKHGPDFDSQEIYSRLEVRREMARDSKNRRNLTTDQPKKILQNKTSFKFNSEIAKVRSFFRSKNAENKLVFKKYKKINKYTNIPIKSNSFNQYPECKQDYDTYDLIQNEMFEYVQNSDEIFDLAVENETEFKLYPKLQSISSTIDRNDKNYQIELKSNVKEDESRESANNLPVTSNIYNVTSDSEDKNTQDICNNFNLENTCDLQSLLIMMTISCNDNDINNEECDEITNDISDIKENNDTAIGYTQDIEKNQTYPIKPIESDTIHDLLNIKSIKNTDNVGEQAQLIKKYINKWRAYVRNKTKDTVKNGRQQKLNLFLDKLSKAKNTINNENIHKSKLLVRDYNSYQHRYKVQKNIIALQKAQLEQQSKMIEELKYNKIVEASRKSLDSMKEEVRRTYYEIDKNLKPKIKLLTNELNIKEIEEPSLVLQCLKVPKFLQRMEARAREREEKHAIIRERRKQLEEEKVRLKIQAELEKAEMNKEEKMKKMKELKEKRKREKIENIRKKQYAERIRALIVMADLHYEKNLMIKYGLRPFKILVQIKRDNIEKARRHYKFQLMKNVFLKWMFYTEDMWFERNYQADNLYRKNLLRKTFNCLKKNHLNFILKRQVAEDYYDYYLTKLVFRKFCESIEIVKAEFSLKWTKAVMYHNCNILFKTFTCWRTLPALNALKREQEARKLKWRQKVLQVVPDYEPPDD